MIEILHKDKLGKPINIDDCVAVPQGNGLIIAKVTKLNPKMVKVSKIPSNKIRSASYNKYPYDCVVINSADVTMYLLQNSEI